MKCATIVMAAGQGTRMKSSTPKVLHRILGRPMVLFPVLAGLRVTEGPVVVVGGEHLEEIRRVITAEVDDPRIGFALQQLPLGTADAVRSGMDWLEKQGKLDNPRVLILNGDVPCLTEETLLALERRFVATSAAVAFLGFRARDPRGYGRVLFNDSGVIHAIREDKELREEDRSIDLVNAGVYLVQTDLLMRFLKGMKRSDIQREFLLTDIVEEAVKQGLSAEVVVVRDEAEMTGVNTRFELSEVTSRMRRLRNRELMLSGVTVVNPDTVDVDYQVTLGPDVLLDQGVALRGRTRIGAGTRVGRGTVVEDCSIGEKVTILPCCVLESSEIGDLCTIGPFAHTRAGTRLEEKAKLGNFVETKKTVVGLGSKVNHLTYLGDCEVGARVNVGAGTITCNYDGVHKHKTVMEDGVFIGSDVQLVAPVTVGKDAVVAAGTTVTMDVPEGALAISRTPQVNVEGYSRRKAEKRQGQQK